MSSARATRKTYSGLIKKDEIGKTKAPLYELPGPDFVYGKPSGDHPYGVKEVTTSWKIHSASNTTPTQKNFRELNKMSVNFGLSSSKSFRQFTKSNNLRVTPNVGTRAVKLVLPDEDFTYGNPNRPSTPIRNVICNDFGNGAATQIEDLYKSRIAETYVAPNTRPKTTKTVQLCMQSTSKKLEDLNRYHDPSNDTLYKMKKFQTAKPKVDTINKTYTPANLNRPQSAMSALNGANKRF